MRATIMNLRILRKLGTPRTSALCGGWHLSNLRTVRGSALALLPLVLALPAWAQSVPPEAQRTVEFYVQHPALRAKVDSACLNDPGHLRNAADCWNAHRANLVVSARETHQMAGDTSDPRTPAYWTKRPNERRFTLHLCSIMTPEQARADSACTPAAASMTAEQQQSTH